jgi:aromatic ring-opening dioxygenase catalytic subunit (LigB family)
MTNGRMPSLFVCHGGGPFPLMTPPMGGPGLTEHLRGIAKQPPSTPKAILIISAHWEEGPELAVTSSDRPEMLFDYYGFPQEYYDLKYPAPGDPALARRVQSVLTAGGHPTKLDMQRGFDHGVFVPLLLAYPEAAIPVVALSLHASLDPQIHLSMGRALAPLRDEGVLLVASGISFHNMRAFQMSGDTGRGPPAGAAFDAALVAAVTNPDLATRHDALARWTALPEARHCHPREEHLLPLLVAAGAAHEGEPATRTFGEAYLGAACSGFRFG